MVIFISTIVKKPSMGKNPYSTEPLRFVTTLSVFHQIKSDVSELGRDSLESRTPRQLSQPRTRNAIREIATDENRAKEPARGPRPQAEGAQSRRLHQGLSPGRQDVPDRDSRTNS